MMIPRPISLDDFTDVKELTGKIESHILDLLKDNELHISMSSLMASFINCFLLQCKDPGERMHYALVFTKILSHVMECINNQEKE